MRKFGFLAHTADIGISIYGKTLPELFINAAQGLFSYIGAAGNEADAGERRISVSGMDTESLLVNWLSELLSRSSTERIVFTDFAIDDFSPTALTARARAHKILPPGGFAHEVKAATYHHLAVKQTRDGYEATVIFDV
jgi:SHS2 domain-containing protein